MQHVHVVAEGLYACFGYGVPAALHGLVQASLHSPYVVGQDWMRSSCVVTCAPQFGRVYGACARRFQT